MANLGNAWHIPQNPEPRLRAAMRDPVGEIVPGMDITILTGNQFQGGGNPGNQLQDGSSLFFKRAADGTWTELPLTFGSEADNNKYYWATIAADTSREFGVGDELQYYLRVAYDDHDTTFLHADGTGSATTSDEPAARSAPFRFTVQDPARWGRWDPVFTFPNVAIHTHVLPNGRVLMWGRQDKSKPGDLDVHKCTPFVWDPKSPLDPTDPQNPSARPAARTVDTDQPKDNDGNTVNLFCSGHTFLPDGRLLVVGGHNIDGDGLDQACTYTAGAAGSSDPGTWAATAAMRKRRWYPTATALPNGTVLVLSGSYKPSPNDSSRPETLLEVWDNGAWKTIPDDSRGTPLEFNGLPLFPRMHVASDGRVFMSGTIPRTQLLRVSQDVADPGGWTVVGDRNAGNRDYAPAVMYDKDKIVYIGGGNDAPQNATPDDLRPPTNIVEIIDLGAAAPKWSDKPPAMNFPRRHHNAVLLPDGTVLVVGGTRGGNGARPAKGVTGFNDLGAGQPVHFAEMWDPRANNGGGAWELLAAEETDRGYHSTAVLLPDGRVLSAGSGEYRPDDVHANPPEDNHRQAQIFSPPYLFRGPRPVITSAPAAVDYGETFDVTVSTAHGIGKVTWIRLPSVTHAFDQSQRINILGFVKDSDPLKVTAPERPEVCPPGHYMLFVLNEAAVPSEAAIVQIAAAAQAAPPAARAEHRLALGAQETAAPAATPAAADYTYESPSPPRGTVVTVGIAGTCPYGIGACWGGAHDALGRLADVQFVDPAPNAHESTARVVLAGDGLPPLDRWENQFHAIVNGSYQLRGFEVALRGVVARRNGDLVLEPTRHRPQVRLAPLSVDKIQCDSESGAPQQPRPSETHAYDEVAAHGLGRHGDVTVTGPLQQSASGYVLYVRGAEM